MAGRFNAFGLFAFQQVFCVVGFDLDEDPCWQPNAFHDARLDETQLHQRWAGVSYLRLDLLLRKRISLLLRLEHDMGALFPAARGRMVHRRRPVAADMFDTHVHKFCPDAQELDAVGKRLRSRRFETRERIDSVSHKGDMLNAAGLRQPGKIDAKQLFEIDLARLGGLFLFAFGVIVRFFRLRFGSAQAAALTGWAAP